MQLTHPCGCVTTMDAQWGVRRAVSKCDTHIAEGGKTGIAHFVEMGAIVNGVPQCSKYCRQLMDALPQLENYQPKGYDNKLLEIGCGFSMYAPWLMQMGYDYLGLDLDPVGTAATGMAYNAKTMCCDFESLPVDQRFDVILAAHCVEHFREAPAALARMYRQLYPGGSLWLIIPDDSDLVNPDHLWFFSQQDIERVLTKIGFCDLNVAVRRHIAREQFIYVQAFKPLS